MESKRHLNILARLRRLNTSSRLLFALDLTKRVMPNYYYFYRIEKFGNPEVLEECIKVATNWVLGLDVGNLSTLRDQLFEVGPDSEEFASAHSTFALNACASCDDLLAILIESDSVAAERVSELSLETVCIFALNEGRLPEDELLDPTSMISRELEYQEGVLAILEGSPNSRWVSEMIGTEYKMSNIGLG